MATSTFTADEQDALAALDDGREIDDEYTRDGLLPGETAGMTRTCANAACARTLTIRKFPVRGRGRSRYCEDCDREARRRRIADEAGRPYRAGGPRGRATMQPEPEPDAAWAPPPGAVPLEQRRMAEASRPRVELPRPVAEAVRREVYAALDGYLSDVLQQRVAREIDAYLRPVVEDAVTRAFYAAELDAARRRVQHLELRLARLDATPPPQAPVRRKAGRP